ncbi:hypothetical protein [Crocosphaera sp. XPORK-15E]|uniref:hypothetical protein n=1 Tax=Crocosphaera sp. XPORK-15E TaxID=3110247 RepID=UPI002B1FEEBF|nr:hypothetical protein [Crocosphaera sp. XPORK-15E]MEA5536606.1 hypothetical protein [Crocosphaera sp. XPORK-15E]
MGSKHFEENSKQIFEQVYPHIKYQRLGTLSSVIYLILDKLEAQELCKKYGIDKKATLDKDVELSEDIIYTVSVNQQKLVKENSLLKQGGEFLKDVSRPVRKSLDEDEDKMEYIVIAAVILIGAYVSQKFLSETSTKNITSPALPSKPIPTAICLAVPASVVYGLTLGKPINREKMIELIEAAPEFLCLKAEEADQKIIDTINQEISPDSQLKFYIRIDIPNGQNIIGEETKYVIKRDIPANTEGKIIQLGRLRDASILKSFKRI